MVTLHTFDLCKQLHALKPHWKPEDKLFIWDEGDEPEIVSTVNSARRFKADNLEQAKQVAKRCVQDEQNLVNVDFDEIWGYDVRDVSEADTVGDVEIIKAEDVL